MSWEGGAHKIKGVLILNVPKCSSHKYTSHTNTRRINFAQSQTAVSTIESSSDADSSRNSPAPRCARSSPLQIRHRRR